MKKFTFKVISVFLATILLITQSHFLSAKPMASGIPSMDETVFSIDEKALENAMDELNELDDFVSDRTGITYFDLEKMGSELITNVSAISVPIGAAGAHDDTLGIPPFWWGFFFGWVGILIVYLMTDNDKEQTKKALNGCLVQGGVAVVFSVVYALFLLEYLKTLTPYMLN